MIIKFKIFENKNIENNWIYFIKENNIDEIKEMIKNNINPNININNKLSNNMSPLNFSISNNFDKIANLLLDYEKTDVNFLSHNNTCLMYAVFNGSFDNIFLKKIINKGVKLNHINNENNNVLHILASGLSIDNKINTKINNLLFLLNYDINWNIKNKLDNTFIDILPNEFVNIVKKYFPKKYEKYLRHINMNKFNI